MSKSVADLTNLSSDVQALQSLQAQVNKPMKELLDELLETARVFGGQAGTPKRSWLIRSRFSGLLNTGAISYGKYDFWVSTNGKFVLETEDTYGSSGQMALTVAEAADLKAVLEKEFASSK